MIQTLDSKWSKLAETANAVSGQVAQKYNIYKPLIKYFEEEMLHVNNIPAALMMNCK